MKLQVKKNIPAYFIHILMIFNIICILPGMRKPFHIFTYLNICMLLASLSILYPLYHYLRRKIFNRFRIYFLLLRIVTMVIFSVTLYLISLTNQYRYKYTYWFFLVSSFLLFIFIMINPILIHLKRRDRKGYPNHIVLTVMILSFVYITLLPCVMPHFLQFDKSMDFTLLQAPQQIKFEKNPDVKADPPFSLNTFFKGRNPVVHPSLQTRDEELLHKISADLSSLGTIHNYVFADLANYMKMRSFYSPTRLYLQTDLADAVPDKSEKSVIYLEIISKDRTVLIKERTGSPIHYTLEVYPVTLSEDTLELITQYVKILSGSTLS